MTEDSFDAEAFFTAAARAMRVGALAGSEKVRVADALSRVLKQDVFSPGMWPASPRATETGYAINAAHTAAASALLPTCLKPANFVVNTETVEPEPLPEGAFSYILRGLCLPGGADAVLPHGSRWLGETRGYDETIVAPVPAGLNVYLVGGDVKVGEKLLCAGSLVTPQSQAALAMAGVEKLEVSRRPRIAVISISPALRPLGEPTLPWQMPDATSLLCQSVLARWGYEADLHRFETDAFSDRMAAARLRSVLEGMLNDYDLVVVTGGLGDQPIMQAKSDSRVWRAGGGSFEPATDVFAIKGLDRVYAPAPGQSSGSAAGVLGQAAIGAPERARDCGVLIDVRGFPFQLLVVMYLLVRPILQSLEGLAGATLEGAYPESRKPVAPECAVAPQFQTIWRTGVLANDAQRSFQRHRLALAQLGDPGLTAENRIHALPTHPELTAHGLLLADAVVVVPRGAGTLVAGTSVRFFPLD